MIHNALFLDFYELTMAQGYYKTGRRERTVFDMFFRRQPFNGGYSIFAGLNPLLEAIMNFRFGDDDIAYLKSTGIFDAEFLNYLSKFRFSSTVLAMDEGSVVFPNEPLIRVEADIIESLLLEGLILNTVNFQSLIATKTARIWLASNKSSIMEFGLRRAQGCDGAMSATRAAIIGGAAGTSNTLAAKLYGVPAMGTMAHAWVMSFDTEEEAFQTYADIYGEKSVFLIDTYNTLESGIENAIKVGKRLKAEGKNFGIRLDSGDIQYLSTEVRKRLDVAGLPNAKITVSNELTEEIIESLLMHKAPIDGWGVGTHMVTGGNESSFTGVYKLAAYEQNNAWVPVMKLSDNPAKTTNPAVKQVWRLYNTDGSFKADVIGVEDEIIEEGVRYKYIHPFNDYQTFSFAAKKVEPLLKPKIKDGSLLVKLEDLPTIHKRMAEQLEHLDPTSKRLLNPHIYKVSLTENLQKIKQELILKGAWNKS
ncbi:nicotinate phosphoribosyltransferase [Treponema phagedenis]|uniref:nicotinate phosphoribosyltransferase n=1 Tax=Treponema phagedenis TaxID=162 RepID=UPI0011E870F6|nr:nicotinate phosphoribosyltransferase [Treponema phagedenis]QEJ96286.1 nicotinate phosphoribosyltransferase [Treponema phagedenis]